MPSNFIKRMLRSSRDTGTTAGASEDRAIDVQAFKEAITINPPDIYFPSRADIRRRLAATNLFDVGQLDWLATEIASRLRSESPKALATQVRKAGAPLRPSDKKELGLRANYAVGQAFVDACKANPKDCAQAAFLIAQASLQQSSFRYERRRWAEVGITHCKLQNCRDERDCSASRRLAGKKVPIAHAELPLKGCDAEYCRCIYVAVVS